MSNSEKKLSNYLNKPLTGLVVYGIIAAVIILVSYLGLKIPVFAVCIIVIFEAIMAVCLSRIPLWIHGIVIIANIVMGIIASKVVFMILMAVIYIVCVSLLYIWNKNE